MQGEKVIAGSQRNEGSPQHLCHVISCQLGSSIEQLTLAYIEASNTSRRGNIGAPSLCFIYTIFLFSSIVIWSCEQNGQIGILFDMQFHTLVSTKIYGSYHLLLLYRELDDFNNSVRDRLGWEPLNRSFSSLSLEIHCKHIHSTPLFCFVGRHCASQTPLRIQFRSLQSQVLHGRVCC